MTRVVGCLVGVLLVCSANGCGKLESPRASKPTVTAVLAAASEPVVLRTPAEAGWEKKPTVPVETLTVAPRELPSEQDEVDAADRFRLAKAFYNGKNYQTAKEVLAFLLGE